MTITHAVTLRSQAFREQREVRVAVDYCANMPWVTHTILRILWSDKTCCLSWTISVLPRLHTVDGEDCHIFKRVHREVHALIARHYQQCESSHTQLPVTFFASAQNNRSNENNIVCGDDKNVTCMLQWHSKTRHKQTERHTKRPWIWLTRDHTSAAMLRCEYLLLKNILCLGKNTIIQRRSHLPVSRIFIGPFLLVPSLAILGEKHVLKHPQSSRNYLASTSVASFNALWLCSLSSFSLHVNEDVSSHPERADSMLTSFLVQVGVTVGIHLSQIRLTSCCKRYAAKFKMITCNSYFSSSVLVIYSVCWTQRKAGSELAPPPPPQSLTNTSDRTQHNTSLSVCLCLCLSVCLSLPLSLVK